MSDPHERCKEMTNELLKQEFNKGFNAAREKAKRALMKALTPWDGNFNRIFYCAQEIGEMEL